MYVFCKGEKFGNAEQFNEIKDSIFRLEIRHAFLFPYHRIIFYI